MAAIRQTNKGSRGPKLNVPEGMTPEQACRRGLDMEAGGAAPEEAAAALGIEITNYRAMRKIVLLTDRGGLTATDSAQ